MLTKPIDRNSCQTLDAQDPLASMRQCFAAAQANTIFLDANSMGAMPVTVPQTMTNFFSEAWVEARRQSWTQFEWLDRPHQIAHAIAHLMGANGEDILACDNTTVNLFKMLTYAWQIRESGSIILTEDGNFPTDLYVAQGLPKLVSGPAELHICKQRDELTALLSPEVAVVYLSYVDYRSSERWDMADINRRAHAVGALTVWDLSQATGAVPIDLMGRDLLGSEADFAVGCGYKYLSMGPGAPAYLWVNPKHSHKAWPSICGWMGHQDVFAFATEYQPLPGAKGNATGTPSVIANEVAWCAAQLWQQVDQHQLWAKHELLGELLIALLEQECGSLGVAIQSPRDYAQRGGHICFSHPGAGPVCEALLNAKVVSSFRKPNALRFGLSALTLRFEDIWDAVSRLRTILETEQWRDPKFQQVSV